MRGYNNQAWLTSAVNDAEVKKALVLCSSLKRSYTSRPVSILISDQIQDEMKILLDYSFDLVLQLEGHRNNGKLDKNDFAKLSGLYAMRSFDKCAYLSPSMLAMKNPDDIFDIKDDHENYWLPRFPENDKDLSMFLFKPDVNLFRGLMQGMANNGTHDLKGFMDIWKKNQRLPENYWEASRKLDKFNNVLRAGEDFLGNENDISMVNFGLLDPLDDSNFKGLLAQRAASHWFQIYEEDVEPLFKPKGSLLHDHQLLSSGSQTSYPKEPIAIIGMSCRYPKSRNLEEFWNLLFSGEDGTGTVPPFRWLREECSRELTPASLRTNAGFLSIPLDEFDDKFFGISPKEVLHMDPQHRILHEVAWEALEDAYLDPIKLKGSSGSVFLGSWMKDYEEILVKAGGNDQFFRQYMGNSIGACAARISHLLDWTGPSVATESGCSSAMVAVHMACRSLHQGETGLALACGVNMIFHPFDPTMMSVVLSKDGYCKTFCEKGDGFARAEGVGVLVLKRYSDAVRDRDPIWGLIRGTAMTQEGTSKSMGTPTVHSEYLAMSGALRDAGVRPEEVSYVETHGTGTPVGDPMEVAAIAKAYNTPERKEPLVIGSVKTNVGHTESVSGITGIMKVILSMKYGVIPKHRNFEKLNPAINLEAVPAVIPLEAVEWKRKEGRRRIAGVSSFGITGTDSHVIVEEAPESLKSEPLYLAEVKERPRHILKLSAKTTEALQLLLHRFQEKLEKTSNDVELTQLAHSANVGRSDFNHRVALTFSSKEELHSNLQKRRYASGEAEFTQIENKICFLFTGQGSQYPGMARGLYETCPVFRIHFDLCSRILKEEYQLDIKRALWGSEKKQEDLSRTVYSQTSIFCVEYALLQLWLSWGVKPDFCLGHSLGEFAAAVGANIISVRDALKLVTERSLLTEKLPEGKMLVLKASEQEVSKALQKFFDCPNESDIPLDFAAVNSSEQTVLAGQPETILEFRQFCTEKLSWKCTVLDASHAFHSRYMDPILQKYRKVAQTVQQLSGSSIGFISGMMGGLVTSSLLDADFWVKHCRDRVRFFETSKVAVEQLGIRTFIEIGPQPILSALTMTNNEQPSGSKLNCFPSLKRSEPEWTTLLNSVGKLWVSGLVPSFDWERLDQFQSRGKVRTGLLPHYPFIGKRFWPEMGGAGATGSVPVHPLLGHEIKNASGSKLFQNCANLALPPQEFIRDHVIGHTVVFPGAGYLEMCLAAGMAAVGYSSAKNEMSSCIPIPVTVTDLRIESPLALNLPPDASDTNKTTSATKSWTKQLQTVVKPTQENASDSGMNVRIFHLQQEEDETGNGDGKWLSHAQAKFSPGADDSLIANENSAEQLRRELITRLETEGDDQLPLQVYDKLAAIGLKFGPCFRSVEKVWKGKQNETEESLESFLTKVKLPTKQNKDDQNQSDDRKDGEGSTQPFIIHPVVLDAMIQSIMMAKLTKTLKKKLHVPIRIGKFVWVPPLAKNEPEVEEAKNYYVHVSNSNDKSSKISTETTSYSAFLLSSEGHLLALMSGVEFIETTARALESVLDQQTKSLPDLWEEVWKPSEKAPALERRIDTSAFSSVDFNSADFQQVMARNQLVPGLGETFERLRKLVLLNMLRGLLGCGWEPGLNSTFQEDDLRAQLKILPEHKQLFGFYISVLAQEGLLKREGDSWRITGRIPPLSEIKAELSTPEYKVDLPQKLEATLLFQRLGERLSDFLQGKGSPLEIMFPADPSKKECPSLSDFYEEYGSVFRVITGGMEIFHAYLRHLSQDKERNCSEKIWRILEVGAGTGSYSLTTLKGFHELGIKFEYTYTDLSPAFFVQAKKTFGPDFIGEGNSIIFKKLDLEEDPISQGFVPGYYDCVLASEVIHATRSISETLCNINMLLREGGLLQMFETIQPSRHLTFLFGLLEGYWRFQDKELRQTHCTLTVGKWDQALTANGYKFNAVFPFLKDEHGVIFATKVEYRKYEAPLQLKSPEQKIRKKKLWLMFQREKELVGEFLVEKSRLWTNRELITVFPAEGDEFGDRVPVGQLCPEKKSIRVRPDSYQDFEALMELVNVSGLELEGIVYGWTLGQSETTEDDVELLQPYLNLARAIASLKQLALPGLITLYNGMVPVTGDRLVESVGSGLIYGFTRSLRNERMELMCRCIDVGLEEPEWPWEIPELEQRRQLQLEQLFYEVWNTESKDIYVAFNGTNRYCSKLQGHKPFLKSLTLPPGADRFKLILPETKSISDLEFGPMMAEPLGPEEIEVEVRAMSLNFRDVLAVIKPTERFKDVNCVGFDLSGVVKRVGASVSKWRQGDLVIGMNMEGHPFPSHVRIGQDQTFPMPPGMNFCEATTLPVVFSTSYHCLLEVAEMTKDDLVLIHTGSGGVGLSALQICRYAGVPKSNIICTAGSKRKRNYLRKVMGLTHVFNSRNTKYCEQILELTSGRGVDVVLNSLTSEGFKEATLEACAEGARFIEMSKLNVWSEEEVQKMRPDVKYSLVDLAEMSHEGWSRLLHLMHDFIVDNIAEAIPYARFDALHIREALQFLQKAKHVGKVVCVMPEVKQKEVYTPLFHQWGSYLITGGLGGIGFAVCEWMLSRGAKYILLAGRSLPSSALEARISQLNQTFNAHVTPVQLDVGDYAQCDLLLNSTLPQLSFPPLRGVMHCAGTLHDGLIQNQQSWTDFSSTLNTKVKGTWNLHRLTKDMRLEHFVLFSSIAALFGSPAQSNHAAGNRFEDTFAHFRHSLGLTATSINWGPWGQVGVATDVDVPGMKPVSTLQGIAALEYAIKSQATQVAAMNLDSFSVMLKFFPRLNLYLDDVWKQKCRDQGGPAGGGSGFTMKSEEFWQLYDSQEERQGRLELLGKQLKHILRDTLNLDASAEASLSDLQSFQDMGVDSLMFVEIKNALQTLFGERITVSASILRDCTNGKLLTEALVTLIDGEEAGSSEAAPSVEERGAEVVKEEPQLD